MSKRIFYIDEVRKMLQAYNKGGISLSKLVELLNEKATGLSAIELHDLETCTEKEEVSKGSKFRKFERTFLPNKLIGKEVTGETPIQEEVTEIKVFETNSGLGYTELAYLYRCPDGTFICIDIDTIRCQDMYTVGEIVEGIDHFQPSEYNIKASPLYSSFWFKELLRSHQFKVQEHKPESEDNEQSKALSETRLVLHRLVKSMEHLSGEKHPELTEMYINRLSEAKYILQKYSDANDVLRNKDLK